MRKSCWNLLNAILPLLMSTFLYLGTHLLFAQEKRQLPENDQCIKCHFEMEVLPGDFQEYDIHLQEGLSCAGCHGGDPTVDDDEIAKSPQKGFIGVPTKERIPRFCGKCHSHIDFMRSFRPRFPTDQEEQYYTSVHGQRLKKGDQKVADCTSCHTAHAILPAKDPRSTVYPLNVPLTCKKCHSNPDYMEEYGILTNQYDDFTKSVHGIALLEKQDTGAPACNDCHGNHGAMPPGITSISHACGTCHINNMQYFSKTKMAREFEREDLHACVECHGNHDVDITFDEMVGTSDAAVCMDCHEEGDKGYEAADKIHEHLVKLVALYDSAEAKRKEVQRIGMEDIEIGFLLQEAKQNLIQARTLVHTFDPQEVGKKTEEGTKIAREALQLAIKEIKDYKVRRLGFGVATIFISILIITLFLKIREME